MRAVLKMMAMLAAFAFCASVPAAAQQQDFTAQVSGYLDNGMAPHAALGYSVDRRNHDMIAPLRTGRAQLFTVLLLRGENYRIYGACDQDCSDVDMEIYDFDGAMADQDVRLDDTPYVQITPRRSGRAYVRIWPASCQQEPCYVGVRVLVGGTPQERPPEAAADESGDYVAGVQAMLDQAGADFAPRGYGALTGGPDTPIEGLYLHAGRDQTGEQRIAYQLRAGQAYRFAAACDSDCTDVDIEVLDGAGRQAASSLGVDNPTHVDFTPSASGAYSVRIWLAACSTEPCFAGQRAFVRAAQ